MIELTPSAQSRLDDYFQDLRRVLSRSPSVDPTDVERDVRDHIDAALVGQAAPVEAPTLDDVLHKLGSPAAWLPDVDARPQTVSPSESLRRIGRRLARGPESYRLAYLSFLVFVAGCSLSFVAGAGGPLVIAIPVSFVFSRAALSLFTPQRLTGGQKWLLYPSLVVVYVPLVAVIMVAPLFSRQALMNLSSYRRGEMTYGELNAAYFAILSIIWLAAGLASAVFPGAVRSVFYPFAGWFSRRVGIGVATLGLIALSVVVAFLYTHGLAVRESFGRPSSGLVRPDIRVNPPHADRIGH